MLAANLLGGYLIGLALARIDRHASLPPALCLFVATGFLGALATCAPLSAEVATLLGNVEFT
jgi:CrcB protein